MEERPRDGELAFDVIIYTTGFDAVTGSFRAVDFQGRDGLKLTDQWSKSIQTYLGLTVNSFPNMFMVMSPHQMFSNIPRSIEYAINWISNLIRYAADNNITYIEATPEGMDQWGDHVNECAIGLLANEVDSWMTRVNKNLAHKEVDSEIQWPGARVQEAMR